MSHHVCYIRHYVMLLHVKAKIISICPTHLLVENYVEVLQVFTAFILFYITCAGSFMLTR